MGFTNASHERCRHSILPAAARAMLAQLIVRQAYMEMEQRMFITTLISFRHPLSKSDTYVCSRMKSILVQSQRSRLHQRPYLISRVPRRQWPRRARSRVSSWACGSIHLIEGTRSLVGPAYFEKTAYVGKVSQFNSFKLQTHRMLNSCTTKT